MLPVRGCTMAQMTTVKTVWVVLWWAISQMETEGREQMLCAESLQTAEAENQC